MKCSKTCKENIHFISPPMSAYFSHAVINLPDGSEQEELITTPTKWHTKGDASWFSGDMPIGALQPIYVKRPDGEIELKLPEIVPNSNYTGIDKDDQYFKDIDRIEKMAKDLELDK